MSIHVSLPNLNVMQSWVYALLKSFITSVSDQLLLKTLAIPTLTDLLKITDSSELFIETRETTHSARKTIVFSVLSFPCL